MNDATFLGFGTALDTVARIATSADRATGRVQLVSVSGAVEFRTFVQCWTTSRGVTLRLKTRWYASSSHFSSVRRNAPTSSGDWIALDGLEGSVIWPATRDEESIGRHSILSGFIFHDHLHVLAGRLDQRFDALGSATIGTAFQLAVAVFIAGTFAVATIDRDGHQIRALPGFDFVLDRAASTVGSVIFAVTRKAFRTTQGPAAGIALDRHVVDWIDKRIANRASNWNLFFFNNFFVDVIAASLDGRTKWKSWTERSFRAR